MNVHKSMVQYGRGQYAHTKAGCQVILLLFIALFTICLTRSVWMQPPFRWYNQVIVRPMCSFIWSIGFLCRVQSVSAVKEKNQVELLPKNYWLEISEIPRNNNEIYLHGTGKCSNVLAHLRYSQFEQHIPRTYFSCACLYVWHLGVWIMVTLIHVCDLPHPRGPDDL